ncbi:MAG: DMT family transporter [Mogibacterium sp.]|nr:DMT family transporter [Mogibacterium sp.]
MSDKNKGNLILLLTAVLWGTGFISQKLGNRVMPPMTFNAVRQLMAAVVLMPLVMRGSKKSGYLSPKTNSRAQLDYKRRRLLKAGVLCGVFMLIGTATQQIGLLTVSAGKSGFISSIYIVFTPLFSVIVGSKVKRRTVLCIALAMLGFAVMSLKGGLSGATQGDWLTLASAAGFAAQIVAVNCFVDKDNAVLLSQLQFLFCGAAGLVVALIMEGPALAGVLAGIPVLLYQTFVPTAGGYTLQIIGQKYTDSSSAALIMSLEAVFAMIFGALFLHEIMSLREIAGAAIIFGATILGQRE